MSREPHASNFIRAVLKNFGTSTTYCINLLVSVDLYDPCPLVPCVAGGFICDLVLGTCDFRHKTPRQGYYL